MTFCSVVNFRPLLFLSDTHALDLVDIHARAQEVHLVAAWLVCMRLVHLLRHAMWSAPPTRNVCLLLPCAPYMPRHAQTCSCK